MIDHDLVFLARDFANKIGKEEVSFNDARWFILNLAHALETHTAEILADSKARLGYAIAGETGLRAPEGMDIADRLILSGTVTIGTKE